MNYQTQDAGGVDWTSIISQALQLSPTWIAQATDRPVPVIGGQGGSLLVTPRGVSGTISPSVLLVGGAVVVLLIVMLNK